MSSPNLNAGTFNLFYKSAIPYSCVFININTGQFSAFNDSVNDAAIRVFAYMNPSVGIQLRAPHDYTVNVWKTLGSILEAASQNTHAVYMNTFYKALNELVSCNQDGKPPRIGFSSCYEQMLLKVFNAALYFDLVFVKNNLFQNQYQSIFSSSYDHHITPAILLNQNRNVEIPPVVIDPLKEYEYQIVQLQNCIHTVNTAKRICLFIEENKQAIFEYIEKTNEDLYVHAFNGKYYEDDANNSNLFNYKCDQKNITLLRYFNCQRSIIFTRRRYIAVNCTKKEDHLVGFSSFKKVKVAVRMDIKGSLMASASMEEKAFKEEKKGMDLLGRDGPGIILPLYTFSYKKIERSSEVDCPTKYRILTFLCKDGNLNHVLNYLKLTLEQKLTYAKNITESVRFIHEEKKCIIRDLKTSNIFIHGLTHYIGDLATVILDSDEAAKSEIRGSCEYLPPELSSIQLKYSPVTNQCVVSEEDKSIIRCNSSFAIDIWALGYIFYQLFINKLQSFHNFKGSYSEKYKTVLEYNLNAPDGYLDTPFEEDSFESLVYHTMRSVPSNRYTISQVSELLKRISAKHLNKKHTIDLVDDSVVKKIKSDESIVSKQ